MGSFEDRKKPEVVAGHWPAFSRIGAEDQVQILTLHYILVKQLLQCNLPVEEEKQREEEEEKGEEELMAKEEKQREERSVILLLL
ncbi:hypothetical protein PIB30_037347 [Stylosanthes scabra]|uniref:Uncharacterized protein n=1 Tax=Stylosanthes scabra TaxID=79078 RepID=A0ABU6SEC1_9FABA|nr:hypothetical protein [Stylosanthes scabra]